MKNPKDIKGQKFGSLTAIEFTHRNKAGLAHWDCVCDCGKTVNKIATRLINGYVKSCGCYMKEKMSKKNYKHGFAVRDKRTSELYIWYGMIKRCNNPKFIYFQRYGGRGIGVCDRWLNSFENFLSDMGKKPTPKHTIERIDNNGNYEPSNCKWATYKEQQNNRSDNVFLVYNGERLTSSQWADKTGIAKAAIYMRIKKGWDAEKILTTLTK